MNRLQQRAEDKLVFSDFDSYCDKKLSKEQVTYNGHVMDYRTAIAEVGNGGRTIIYAS